MKRKILSLALALSLCLSLLPCAALAAALKPGDYIREPGQFQTAIDSFSGEVKVLADSELDADTRESFKKYQAEGVTMRQLSVDGIPLYEAWVDDGTVKPLVISMWGSMGKYAGIGDYARLGFHVVAFDPPGLGDHQVGAINEPAIWAAAVRDIDTLVEYYNTVDRVDAARFALEGLSMGGTISYCYVAHGKYKPAAIAPVVGTPNLTKVDDSILHGAVGDKPDELWTEEELQTFVKGYSPILWPERFLDVWIYAGGGTEDTSYESLRELKAKLTELGGTKFEFHFYEGVGHGAGPGHDSWGYLKGRLLPNAPAPAGPAPAAAIPAEEAGLVPDYTDPPASWSEPVTRERFAETVMKLIEVLCGEVPAADKALSFSDCDNPAALQAVSLGIMPDINIEGAFGPDVEMLRVRAGHALVEAAGTIIDLIDVDTFPTEPAEGRYVFEDADQLNEDDAWLFGLLRANGVLLGGTETVAGPDAGLTMADLLDATYRMYCIAKELDPKPTPKFISTGGNDPVKDGGTAVEKQASLTLDGKATPYMAYALRTDAGDTNYIKLRDLAYLLKGTGAEFSIDQDADKTILVNRGETYKANGSEMQTPFTGDQAYAYATSTVQVNGQPVQLQAFTLGGGGYTYFKLADIAKALDFDVHWVDGAGIVLDTTRPYAG